MRRWRYIDVMALVPALWMAAEVLFTILRRFPYPYDLEWMEGGMLVHAWRIQQWLPLYVDPDERWIPYIYPPGYAAVVAFAGLPLGLSPQVGRAVSIFGTFLATAATVYGGWRHGKSLAAGILGACFFLSCFPDSGAFYDLVRPDALGVGLLAWSVVLGLDSRRRVRVLAAVLLAASFAVKQNFAVFGLPMWIGIAAAYGWREGLRFAAISAGLGLSYVGILEIYSGGHFLTTLLAVPAAHPLVAKRFIPGTINEFARFFPTLLSGVALGLTAGTMRILHRWRWLVLSAGLLTLVAAVGIGAELPLLPNGPRGGRAAILTTWGAVGQLVGISASGMVGMLIQTARGQKTSTEWVYGVGIGAVAFLIGGLMRAHHGGFLNVYIPMFWVLSLAGAVVLGRSRLCWQTPWVVALGALFFAAQAVHDLDFRPDQYVPTQDDVAGGDHFVDALRDCDGPVLSPFAPWLPVIAGHEPSFHLIALWDIRHRDGPYTQSALRVRDAMASHYWSCIVDADRRNSIGYGIKEHYKEWRRPDVPGRKRGRIGPAPFVPRTGWRVRPVVIRIPAR